MDELFNYAFGKMARSEKKTADFIKNQIATNNMVVTCLVLSGVSMFIMQMIQKGLSVKINDLSKEVENLKVQLADNAACDDITIKEE